MDSQNPSLFTNSFKQQSNIVNEFNYNHDYGLNGLNAIQNTTPDIDNNKFKLKKSISNDSKREISFDTKEISHHDNFLQNSDGNQFLT